MRAAGLGLVLVVGGLGACSGEQLGGGRRTASGTPPIGTTTIDASTGAVYSDACWASSLPAETQPIFPASTLLDGCVAGTGLPNWSYPQNPAGTNADDRRYLVGRWTTCNGSLPNLPVHEAIEFGANGRWRLLAVDGSVNSLPPPGTLIPLAGTGTSGYYYLLGSGQLDLNVEDPGGGGWVLFVTFTDGMDTLKFSSGGSTTVYARTAPSPLNGADNPPPTTAGACSMVGTWDVPPNDGPIPAPAALFSFDAAGNFVAGPEGANLCDGHTMYGTYALSSGMFQLTSNVGFGSCPWLATGGFSATFDAPCDHLSLTRLYDGCTGGRGYFNLPTTITRRTAPSADAGTTATLGPEVP